MPHFPQESNMSDSPRNGNGHRYLPHPTESGGAAAPVAEWFADGQQTAEAIMAYERALQIRPDYADVLYNLGLLLVQERRAGDAVVCLEQAVRLRPENAEAHNNLSMALAELGRFDDAIASCD